MEGNMEIIFHKISDSKHRVTIQRHDGSTNTVELASKDFLRHDLAHFAVEVELGLAGGVWGSVAAGGSLAGTDLNGADMELAERLAGPMQTLMRTAADVSAIHGVLQQLAPEVASTDLADRLHERMRSLTGHWASTGYREDMVLRWGDLESQ